VSHLDEIDETGSFQQIPFSMRSNRSFVEVEELATAVDLQLQITDDSLSSKTQPISSLQINVDNSACETTFVPNTTPTSVVAVSSNATDKSISIVEKTVDNDPLPDQPIIVRNDSTDPPSTSARGYSTTQLRDRTSSDSDIHSISFFNNHVSRATNGESHKQSLDRVVSTSSILSCINSKFEELQSGEESPKSPTDQNLCPCCSLPQCQLIHSDNGKPAQKLSLLSKLMKSRNSIRS